MASTLKDIRALIAAKFSAVNDGAQTPKPLFGEVFEYAQGDFSKFPAVVILPTGGSEGSVLDTHRNHRTFSFLATLYHEQTDAGKSKSDVNDVMTTAVDAVLLAFDRDKNFDFAVEQVRVVKMDFNFKVANGTFDFATFDIDVVVVVPNYEPA